MQPKQPWISKWGEGERFDGGGQGDTFFVPKKNAPKGVMKLLRDVRTKDPKSRRRMFQEVANLKILHSAGARVPQVLDDNTSEFENVDVPLYFVMERIVGDTLAKLIEQQKKLDFQASVALTLDLCKTFGIAVRERISHRDIKPENLIVTSMQPAQVVVVDFGLSFNEDKAQQLTEVEESFDNKFISLPERRGPGENKRDPRSDITGLCAVLFYCLTGCAPRNLRDSKNRPPHRWESFSMTGIGPTPTHVAILNGLFDRGFQYELQSRFQTLEEFEGRVRELLSDTPLEQTEDLSVVAQRESGVLRETDRKTLLAELRIGTKGVGTSLTKQTQAAAAKLQSTLFSFLSSGLSFGHNGAHGNQLFSRSIDLRVSNHDVRVGIGHLIACKGNECTVLRRIYDIAFNNSIQNPEETVVMRYGARVGQPDCELIAADFDKAVAIAIPRLRKLIEANVK